MGLVVMLIVLAVLLPIIQLNQLVRSAHEHAVSLDDKLVVAISSRALFNFEEENRIFESGDAAGYMQLQLERLDRRRARASPSR